MWKTVNRSEQLRDYYKNIPNATPKEAIAAMAKRGIKVGHSLACQVKYQMKHGRPGRKPKAVARTVDSTVTTTINHIAKPRSSGRAMTASPIIEGYRAGRDLFAKHILEAHAFSKKVGGISKAKAAVELLEQLV